MPEFFDTSRFMPHGHCYLWRPEILWLNVGSDLLIALSYFAIPAVLVYFIRKRSDLPFGSVFWLFGAFILLCGITHAVSIWTVWNPDYQVQGLVKLATGVVSGLTATALLFVMPKAMKLRSPEYFEAVVRERTEDLNKTNRRLVEALAEHNRTEAALRSSEGRLQALTDALPVMIAYVDEHERYRFINDAYGREWGKPKRQIIGRRICDVVGDEAYQRMQPYVRKALAGEAVSFDLSMDSESGQAHKLINYVPEYSDSGHPRGFYTVITDITTTKRAEMVLGEAHRAADAANRAKSEFLANVSHELRTPLSAILGFTEVLSDQVQDEDARVSVDTIRRNGEYLLDLLNDILDLSKIEAGRMDLELKRVRPDEIVSEVQSLMNVPAAEKGIELSVVYEDHIPQTIETDPVRLRQVLMNLVSNAIKFTDEGAVEVVVRLHAEDTPRLEFEVRDTGIGINPSDVERLFEPFSQADASTTREYGGTGLGLAISRQLANLLGGTITVDTEVGRGSTFRVTVLTGTLAGVKMVSGGDSQPGERVRPAYNPRIRGRFLVVDDRQDIRHLVRHFIQAAGGDVVTAENGKEAIDAVARAMDAGERFDLIIMDMQMPLVDGYQATREIRDLGFEEPIIALTASAMAGEREKCVLAGCTDYVSKPVDASTLLRSIVRHLGRSEASSNDTHELPIREGEAKVERRVRSVLVVEDSPDVAAALKAILKREGLDVRLVANGHDALKEAEESVPDAILCDLGLPGGMSGTDVARKMRDMPALCDTRLIALSGRDDHQRECYDAGFETALKKPCNISALRAALGIDDGG